MFVTLTEYARKVGRDANTVRKMAIRGGFTTARKSGGTWLIDEDEPYPDRRVKNGKYKKQHE